MSAWRVKRQGRDTGFTLVEVLCAVAVLSIALVASFRLINQQTRASAGLNERVVAHWVAMNRFEEMRMGIPAQSRDGAVRMGGIDWQLDVSRSAGPAGLARIEIKVSSKDRAGALLVGYLPSDQGAQ